MKRASVFVLAAVAANAVSIAAPKPASPTVRLNGMVYRISGPYHHKNLSVFLLHAGTKDTANYLTLQEGLKAKAVSITEKDQSSVSELVITNNSDRPLFLQEGDRIVGGKQDRIISSSLVIPPRTHKVPLPAFCVEHGRWSEGAKYRSFSAPAEAAIAPLSVRRAAKVEQSQAGVWDKVAKEKSYAGTYAGAAQRTSSLSEAMDNPAYRKFADAGVKTLEGLTAKHNDAVGVAIAVNGRIEEVNIYPGHGLLVKLYPRLLRSYAMEAARKSGQALAVKLKPGDVTDFLTQKRTVKARDTKIDANNRLKTWEMPSAVELQTNYNDRAVHQQYMRK